MQSFFESIEIGHEDSIPFDYRITPPVIAGLTCLSIASSFLPYSKKNNIEETPKCSAWTGGWMVVFWTVAQSVGLAALLTLYAIGILEQGSSVGSWLELGSLIYSFLLSLSLLLPLPRPLHERLKGSLLILTLATLAVELIRNGQPFIWFHGRSVDKMNELTIIRIATLTATTILPPLCKPRTPYPLLPNSLPTPEETASPLSLLFYSFIDITVYKAFRSKTDLSLPDFIPLRDREDALVLREKGIKWLDPRSKIAKKTLGRGILRIWWKELVLAEVGAVISTALGFCDILGLNRILSYVQSPSEATIRPWFWVVVFGIGPLLQAISYNQFIYWSYRMTRQMESVLLQLFFDHSLRVRVNDTPESTSKKQEENVKDKKKKSTLSGRINSLMSSDINQLKDGRMVLFMVPDSIFKAIISATALWALLGWSSLVAMGLTILIIPISRWAGVVRSRLQKVYAAATDARIEKVTEALTGMRATKMFGLEGKVKEELSEARESELRVRKRSSFIRLLVQMYLRILPSIVIIATLWTFTGVQKGTLNASTLFTALKLLTAFSNCARSFFNLETQLIEPMSSLGRMQDFISNTPLIHEPPVEEIKSLEEEYLGFEDASFHWTLKSPDEDESSVPFKLVMKDLKFPIGKISIITGPTGCGKTSLLMALLREMDWIEGSTFNLPRTTGVAYVHQQSWLQNLTVKNNILFGNAFDQDRYDAVVQACGLDTDLSLWAAGDQTEVGEKGVTLSGGQKARITLARAVYSPAKTLLIDDCFSSLDVQTSKLILDRCFAGDLIKGRTVLLVTHHLSLAKLIADFLVVMDNGRVESAGTMEKVLADVPHELVEALDDDQGKVEEFPERPLEEKIKIEEAPSGKLIVEEEKAEGSVSSATIALLFNSLGGVIFWLFYFIFDFGDYAINAGRQYWFSLWARQYGLMPANEVDIMYYLAGYGVLTLIFICCAVAGFVLWVLGVIRSGRVLHEKLLTSVMSCKLRFLDVTPHGRIVGRFTSDIRKIDTSLPNATNGILTIPINLLVNTGTLLLVVPAFIPAAGVVAVVAFVISQLYMSPSRAAMRENASKQSKLFTNFGDALAGLCSIRAFGAQEEFKKSGLKQINDYITAQATLHFLARWNSARFDFISSAFSTILAVYLVFGNASNDAPAIGFALTVTGSFVESVMEFTKNYSDWQIELNSLERVRDYLEIDHEPATISEKRPPAYWPSSGDLKVQGLTASYTEGGPVVLDGLTFKLNSGERCGVVGRTGSGKSTLALALLRLIPNSGKVELDGLDTSTVNLEDVRSKITIIPQDPTLYSGDIRKNIDPYGTMDDAQLNDILRSVGLLNSGGSAGGSGSATPKEGRVGVNLGTMVSAGGANLSQGTRQLVSLARGLVRSSKLYIVDEATSSVDFETDALIQRTLSTELKDVTLITIAHRILTIIDYDKILVLGKGKIEEFDTPQNLLAKPDGFFKALVDASSDRQELIRLVNAKS